MKICILRILYVVNTLKSHLKAFPGINWIYFQVLSLQNGLHIINVFTCRQNILDFIQMALPTSQPYLPKDHLEIVMQNAPSHDGGTFCVSCNYCNWWLYHFPDLSSLEFMMMQFGCLVVWVCFMMDCKLKINPQVCF